MKHFYNYSYNHAYNSDYDRYYRKHVATRVRKHFMTPEEFLGIYEQYQNIRTVEDMIFVVELIKSSKTYKHYKTNKTNLRPFKTKYSLEEYIKTLSNIVPNNPYEYYISMLTMVMQWLYSRTVHASSLNSVTFR